MKGNQGGIPNHKVGEPGTGAERQAPIGGRVPFETRPREGSSFGRILSELPSLGADQLLLVRSVVTDLLLQRSQRDAGEGRRATRPASYAAVAKAAPQRSPPAIGQRPGGRGAAGQSLQARAQALNARARKTRGALAESLSVVSGCTPTEAIRYAGILLDPNVIPSGVGGADHPFLPGRDHVLAVTQGHRQLLTRLANGTPSGLQAGTEGPLLQSLNEGLKHAEQLLAAQRRGGLQGWTPLADLLLTRLATAPAGVKPSDMQTDRDGSPPPPWRRERAPLADAVQSTAHPALSDPAEIGRAHV